MADLKDYEADREKLLSTHRECVFNRATKDGWPVGVSMSYQTKDWFYPALSTHLNPTESAAAQAFAKDARGLSA